MELNLRSQYCNNGRPINCFWCLWVEFLAMVPIMTKVLWILMSQRRYLLKEYTMGKGREIGTV